MMLELPSARDAKPFRVLADEPQVKLVPDVGRLIRACVLHAWRRAIDVLHQPSDLVSPGRMKTPAQCLPLTSYACAPSRCRVQQCRCSRVHIELNLRKPIEPKRSSFRPRRLSFRSCRTAFVAPPPRARAPAPLRASDRGSPPLSRCSGSSD